MIIRSVDGERIIGNLDTGIFTKRVRGSAHMLRVPRAWGIDCEPYKKDIRPNCHTIIIEDIESCKTYKVSLSVFDANKLYLNRGFGEQYALTLKYWQVVSQGQGALI